MRFGVSKAAGQPMDEATQRAMAFPMAMAPVREALYDLCRRLKGRAAVATVRVVPVEACTHPSFGVSAVLHDGSTVDFWLDLDCRTWPWQLEYAVLRHDPHEDGSHPGVEFPRQAIESARQLPEALVTAVAQLAGASETEATLLWGE